MRSVGVVLLVVWLVALAACAPATPTPPPPPPPTPKAAAVATASPTPTAAPTPTPSPPPATPTKKAAPSVEAPLAAAGRPVLELALSARTEVRYGVLAEGLARSDDGGRTWRQVSAFAPQRLLVSPHDPRTLYSGEMVSCYKDEPVPPFHRSTDGGETWQQVKAGQGIRPVAVHPARANTVYGISCWTFNVSQDGGQTWTPAGPTQGWDITSILPLTDGRLRFLAVLTSEGGASHLAWFDEDGKLAQNLPEGLVFWGRGILTQAGRSLYIADSTGIWRSDDNGLQWELFKEGLADVILPGNPLTDALTAQDWERGYGLFALAADPARPERLALGTVRGLYLSEDRGERWRPAGIETLAKVRIDQLTWDPNAPSALYVTTPNGVQAARLP